MRYYEMIIIVHPSVPDDELSELTTPELVEQVTSTPLFIMMIMYPQPDGGLESFTKSFNGAETLLGRQDAAKTILAQYKKLYEQISERAYEERFTFRFTIMEVLLSSDKMIEQLYDPELRREVITSIIMSLDARELYDKSQPEPVYGKATLEYSALAVAKYLDCLNSSKYQEWFSQKSETGLFTQRNLSYEESEEVINIGRDYIQSIN